MSSITDVIAVSQSLMRKDGEALLVEIGLREKAIQKDPTRSQDANIQVEYTDAHMGLVEDFKSLGRKIVNRWNKELYEVVCAKKTSRSRNSATDNKIRTDIISALNLGDAAVIATVVSALIALGAPAAIAAPVAPFLVKKVLMPAKDELCDAWGEALHA